MSIATSKQFRDGKHMSIPRFQCEGLAPSQQQHQTVGATNVGELVVKAKKAAVNLWLILHAQVRDICAYLMLFPV